MASISPAFKAEARKMMPLVTELPESKLGRPSSYDPIIADEIIERLSNGEPMTAICRDKKMPSFPAVMRWEEANPDFRERSTRAMLHGTHFMAGDCIAIADDPETDVQHRRLRIDTRMRLIGKWNAKIYGDRKILAGDENAPLIPRTIDPRRLDPDQREMLKQLLLAASAPEVDGEFTEAED